MFLQDATGSQQPYIDTARNGITQICNTLLSGGKFAPQDLRFGLVAFRDHPPEDQSFIIQEYPFTSDVGSFTSNLGSLRATGGGDGPESQSDALSAAYKADWKDEATKVVVLITDSPPHGIGEDTDAFPEGCPLRKSYFCPSVLNQRLMPKQKLTRSVLQREWEKLASLWYVEHSTSRARV
jgi:hypothetical protein